MSAVPELLAPPITEDEAMAAIRTLRYFMSRQQLYVIAEACKGEERQFFFDKLVELATRVSSMPKVYEQDGLGEQAIVHLHYFCRGCDWFITERDTTKEQQQAFGFACLGDPDCAELGYISIAEIIQHGGELDMYFPPRSLADAKLKL
jgi:hypothetical protein